MKTLPDGAAVTNTWDALGNLTKLAMPNGMAREMAYDTAGRLLGEQLKNGASVAHQFTNSYFGNSPLLGMLEKRSDPRGFSITNVYDDLPCLAASATVRSTNTAYQITNALAYDRRSWLTNLSEATAFGTVVVTVYRIQYGFNPAPMSALNSLNQVSPTAARLAVAPSLS